MKTSSKGMRQWFVPYKIWACAERIFDEKQMAEACERFNYQTEDDLFASVGYGEVSPHDLSQPFDRRRTARNKSRSKSSKSKRWSINRRKRTRKMKVRHEGGIVIEGVDNLLIRISCCCNPVPGDSIVGYITRPWDLDPPQRCPNVQNKDAANRLIDVEGRCHRHQQRIRCRSWDLRLWSFWLSQWCLYRQSTLSRSA